MRFLIADLSRIAGQNVPNVRSYRTVFAALLLEAGLLEDQFARASYLEGLLGFNPGAITGQERKIFGEAREALASGEPNRIVDTLRHTYKMSEGDILKMVGAWDSDVYNALVSGVRSNFRDLAYRGIAAEDVISSLSAGISAVTGKSLKYGKGKSIFHWLGTRAPAKITLKGIKSIIFKEAKNRALDVIRGTREEELTSQTLDAPADGGWMLSDILEQPSVGRANFVDLARAIYHNPRIMNSIDSMVQKYLTTPSQEAVWKAVMMNPDLLRVDKKGVGINARPLAKAVSELTGVKSEGKSTEVSVGKTFRSRVLPAMVEALASTQIAKKIIETRDILQLIQEAQRRPPATRLHIPVEISGLPKPRSTRTKRRDPADFPDLKPPWARAASARVAFRFWMGEEDVAYRA